MFDKKKARSRLKERMIAGAMSRKGKYFRRPLQVNGRSTSFRVVKINKEWTLEEQVLPLLIWPESECYVLQHVTAFTFEGFASPCDLVVANHSGKVTAVHVRIHNDQKIDLHLKMGDVWLFPPATANSLQIRIGAIVSTRETVLLAKK